ncbi:MAG: hypothetical protein CSA75_05615, partial [Sorangium cellulosum]
MLSLPKLIARLPSPKRLRTLFSTFAFLLTAAPCSQANATPYGFDDNTWEGATEFLQTLSQSAGRDQVVTTSDLPWDKLRPQDALVVLYPLQNLSPNELSAFLRSGGRVAILDDFGASEANLKRFQIERIAAPTRPIRSLRNNPALALAEPVSDMAAGKAIGIHPVVA